MTEDKMVGWHHRLNGHEFEHAVASLVMGHGLWVRRLPCGGLSGFGARALGAQASAIVSGRLSSCAAWPQLLHGRWDLPGPRIELVSPTLAADS